jgi:type III restriction enzyme
MAGVTTPPDIADIVVKTTNLVIHQTIDILKILVIPKGQVRSLFRSFSLDLICLNNQI